VRALVNVAGREVASLSLAGTMRATWDGDDARGGKVAPGVLFVHVVAPDGTTIARGRVVWLP
jgi:hypothetical protein